MKIELVDGWADGSTGENELRRTTGSLRISANSSILTGLIDDRSQSYRDSVRVSFYPLAQWFASSWWRLRWEPGRDYNEDTDWQMSHQITGAGEGYIWPNITFRSDGEGIMLSAEATPLNTQGPIRYVSQGTEWISASVFEASVDHFIDTVLDRLNSIKCTETNLHRLWYEVGRERRHDASYLYRKLEAELGFDPDAAEADLIQRFINLSNEAGISALAEVALACAGEYPEATLSSIIEMANTSGVNVSLSSIQAADSPTYTNRSSPNLDLPWQRGYQIARDFRSTHGVGSGPLSNANFGGDLLSVSETTFDTGSESAIRTPISLGVKNRNGEGAKLSFRNHRSREKRFEAARFIGDYMFHPKQENWLPITSLRTVRQKIQRAFAAELLCPIDDLRGFLKKNISYEHREDAADHFQVSIATVEHQLNNHNMYENW